MFSLKSHITKDSEIKQETDNQPTKKVIVRDFNVNMKKSQNEDPVEVNPLPTHTKVNPPVFHYLHDKMEDQKEKDKRKQIKYKPGEKLLVSIDKQLKKEKTAKSKEEQIETFNNSITNVLKLLNQNA
jgi:hypothetical protein